MAENPYSTPEAALVASPGNTDTGIVKLYSPTQAACGTIGGPVGLVYFLWYNFRALNDERAAKMSLVYGALFILALIIVLPFLPDEVPGMAFTVAYIVTARLIVEKFQMTKQAIAESPAHDFHSNWRVFGMGILCLLVSIVVMLGPLLVLASLGIWNP